MLRIRYVGEQLIARAFDHTFHRKRWDKDHGLDSSQVVVLASNPQFEVENCPPTHDTSTEAANPGGAG